jgi:hypothetical protein
LVATKTLKKMEKAMGLGRKRKWFIYIKTTYVSGRYFLLFY